MSQDGETIGIDDDLCWACWQLYIQGVVSNEALLCLIFYVLINTLNNYVKIMSLINYAVGLS